MAVLVPSFAEGFGLPVLEAMARGVSVIASSIPPFEEIAGDTVRFAPPGNATAWAEAMVALARDAEERDRLAALGRARAGGFTWRGRLARVSRGRSAHGGGCRNKRDDFGWIDRWHIRRGRDALATRGRDARAT